MLTDIVIAIICVALYWRFADPFGEQRRTATAWGTVIDLPMRGIAMRVPHPQIRFQTTDGQEVTFYLESRFERRTLARWSSDADHI
ncbi:hypothetical protein [Bradyrhizobium sp. C9]|uniref:hypothetical protein n=1 Tax=Bradyrhizobium sp. C9 TaxID=142585 RepID=UPI000BE94EE7|nr:hypothetical protein [Bradyrhizobium sp. C9]PDT76748.1 hypothetical protein CO675_14070 [Bradyrhizobium sp. C9]